MNTKQATESIKKSVSLMGYTVRRAIEEANKDNFDLAALKDHLAAAAESLILAGNSVKELEAIREEQDPETFFKEEPSTCHELRGK